ncbi:MAG: arsenate reductase ArsC [Nitrospiraceae bacterium]|nr:arsenate reductase ArsC [Nitrospiraceae bacterium]
MTRVMFLCTGNTCRSQMAEGFARELGKDLIEAHSAGLMPAGVIHPKAVAVMREVGIDIAVQKSKAIDRDLLGKMDIVVTLCGNAEASCPVTPPSIRRIHWPIDDPVAAVGTEGEVTGKFREARDEIKERIRDLVNTVNPGGRP